MNQSDNCSSNEWQHSVNLPTLDRDRVHVWRARLDLPDSEVDRLAKVLSPDEVAKANRFRFARHQRRFIVARGILRQLLGNYLDIEPKDVQFEYGDRGKPLLKLNPTKPLQFNLSHSHEYALYGFTYDRLIGVDLEYLREMPDIVKIARRFFSPQEYELLARVSNQARVKLFFQLWTAKEAYLKAIGTGISDSLADVNIDVDEVLAPRLFAIKGDKLAAAKWSLCSCVPAINYIASIAIKTTPYVPIDFWHWDRDRG